MHGVTLEVVAVRKFFSSFNSTQFEVLSGLELTLGKYWISQISIAFALEGKVG